MKTYHRICVIMAGGSGERFWPLSRKMRPKQLLRLANPEQSLLEETIVRIAPMIPASDVYIATARHLVEPIRSEGVGIPTENVLAEPCKRNTAGCLAYVAAQMLARYGTEAEHLSMAILSADHRIADPGAFRDTVEAALQAAEAQGCLATIGVRPDRPETGYGYIEIREGSAPLCGDAIPVYPVAGFREKPNAETAAQFVASGRFLWNTGMFFWTFARFMEELGTASPGHAEAVRAMAKAMQSENSEEVERIFAGLDDISIDYALMEKANGVAVAPAAFEWDDVGAWDALDRAMEHDAEGNVTVGGPVLAESRNCIVYNEPGAERMAVAVVGVEGLAVVVREDGVLVIPKERAQEVRKAIALLKERNASQL